MKKEEVICPDCKKRMVLAKEFLSFGLFDEGPGWRDYVYICENEKCPTRNSKPFCIDSSGHKYYLNIPIIKIYSPFSKTFETAIDVFEVVTDEEIDAEEKINKVAKKSSPDENDISLLLMVLFNKRLSLSLRFKALNIIGERGSINVVDFLDPSEFENNQIVREVTKTLTKIQERNYIICSYCKSIVRKDLKICVYCKMKL